ncbi:hypothetical protein, partial [Ralstonia pseudosolanacearum]|uniref:hypothetical protein n=1 Tax=Ralstonia pseudosolanacearum TaxID=1310165 RepID=UPI003CEDA153
IADLLSCHANNNAQPPAFDDLVLLATLNRCNPYTLNEDLATLIGILFWVTIIVLIAILY